MAAAMLSGRAFQKCELDWALSGIEASTLCVMELRVCDSGLCRVRVGWFPRPGIMVSEENVGN